MGNEPAKVQGAARKIPAITKDEGGGVAVKIEGKEALAGLYGTQTYEAASGVLESALLALGEQGGGLGTW